MTYLHNTGKISARIADQSSSLQREKKMGSKWTMGGAQSRAPYMLTADRIIFTSGSLATRRSRTGNLIGQCEVIL